MEVRRKLDALQRRRAAVTVASGRARLDAAAAVEEGPRGYARRPTGLGSRWRALLAVLCAAWTIGWLGAERDRASEGNRLYDAGRYDEAGTAYGEGLVDYPESTRLRFNLGAAQYRQGNFADAVTTLEKLLPDVRGEGPVGQPPGKTSELAAEAAYNIGNARYRMGKQAEEKDPQQAIALYEQALLAYKWAMALDPDDSEPKFNHEFVEQQAKELKDRLEKQQQEREKQEGEKQQQEQAQQQPGEGEEQGSEKEQAPKPEQEAGQGQQAPEGQENAEQPESGKGQPDSERASKEQAQEETGGQQEESQKESKGAMPEQAAQEQAGAAQEQAGAAGETGAEPAGEAMTAAEARTLIDAARGEEAGPGEVRRQIGVAGVGEPVEDW